MKDTVITVDNVSYEQADYLIIDNMSFTIKKNSFTVIAGKSGAGKSTLLKLIAGIYQPTMGTIIVRNKNINDVSHDEHLSIRRNIGFCFQDAALLSNLTIEENLMLPLNFHFKYMSIEDKKKKILDHLTKIDLVDTLTQRPAQLSTGEQKIISFVRAIITDPEFLLLDEPLTFVDPVISEKIMFLTKDYSDKEWTTVIFITHSNKIFHQFADSILFIENKKIFFHDTKNNFLERNDENLPELVRHFKNND